MSDALAAAVAFFALGALLTGSVLLLLFNPHSRRVRWWIAFQAANMVWLALQGWAFSMDAWAEVNALISGTVHLFPALFVAFALVDAYDRPDREALLAVAAGVLTLPVGLVASWNVATGWWVAGWQMLGWTLGSAIMFRGRSREPWPAGTRRLGLVVVGLLAVIAPVSMMGGFILGVRMWVFVMPLVVVLVQLLVFVGVARLRFYDIEVRARRTGEIAAEAAEQERFAVLGELSASLAHEIRNPLTGVRSLAQRLAEEEIDAARRRRYATVILEEVGRVERLVTNLLGVARRPAREAVCGSTRLEPLFDDLLLLLGARAEKAGVALRADAGRLAAGAAREPLAQALLNLLLNALAHTPAGGAVELVARRDGDRVRVAVRDQGPGIDPALRERIWEPFVSGGRGTGLGLAVVRRLAREQGWEVEASDAPGGGAEFRLTLPAERAAPAPPAEAVRAQEVG